MPQKNTEDTAIRISNKNWKKLSRIKLDQNKKSFNAVIDDLLDNKTEAYY